MRNASAKVWEVTSEQRDAIELQINALRAYTGKAKVAIVKAWDGATLNTIFVAPLAATNNVNWDDDAEYGAQVRATAIVGADYDRTLAAVRAGHLSENDAMNSDD